jgi:hypothetical protein
MMGDGSMKRLECFNTLSKCPEWMEEILSTLRPHNVRSGDALERQSWVLCLHKCNMTGKHSVSFCLITVVTPHVTVFPNYFH